MAFKPESSSSSSSSSQNGTMSTTRKEDLKKGLKILCMCSLSLLVIYVSVASLVQTVKQGLDDRPAMYSVELVGAEGIRSALDPGAESPAFKLLVRVDNGHVYGVPYGGGHLLVSYAGVPLARGRIPAFSVGTKKAVAVAVDAASCGIGIPDGLFRSMLQDRRTGVAQLQVELWLRNAGFFTCNVDLMGTEQHNVSRCDSHHFISSS